MENIHVPNPRIAEKMKTGPHLTGVKHIGFQRTSAIFKTNLVCTIRCVSIFAGTALISLSAAIEN
ncbi:MAG: hypothetical protein HGA31_05055 [Candidatus Moranbacteria bacterium]|nr:hypothetical protein [Candidatus Moranbacteria bacterium]